LGDTLAAIALEKAGIAKPGVPLVTFVEDSSALATITERAQSVGAPLVRVEDVARVESESVGRAGQAFRVTTAQHTYEVRTPLLGEFQRQNAATAIVVLEQLSGALRPSVDAVERGFASIAMPGRMEVFGGHPTLVFDIAHNAEKAEHLVQSLRERFEEKRYTFVVAVSEGKDATEILRALATLPANFILTAYDTPGREAIRPARLASIVESLGHWGRAIGDPAEALEIARRTAASDDVVVVTGSTFIVSTLRPTDA
jgi:dihydrofolate synthase/folylpolyglutamate synthase